MSGKGSDLMRITIKRRGGMWRVIRERKDSGESANVKDLGEALRFVLTAYDRHGRLKQQPTLFEENPTKEDYAD